ncbi:MAG TPA: pyrroloquinoline quinone-dependent dehydrogenase, partial [Bryobacteraceae bacterium]|nr:pyrroloquinoline quinone-dependent dehydrogenase [Bryobacteraceae bacterium]
IAAESGATDWPVFGHDAAATRYSPLKQIDTGNVARLERAWTFHTGKPGTEAIPVVVHGVMYVNAANGVFAVNPETGKEIWHYEATKVALRGLAYWPGDGVTHPHIYIGIGSRLVALDAATGKPAVGFGDEGSVDLKQGVLGDLKDAIMGLQSPPAVYRNLIITGSVPNEGQPSRGAYGDIRAWDARTGKLVWQFHTIPRPGEPGHETWEGDSWKNRSGTNAWGFLTIDVARGLVFVPLGSPTSDFNGSDRHGQGLYGNSLVALDATTGKLRWYRQLVHHDLWDYDLAAAPILIDVHRNGRRIPAVAQITKMGLAFIFDRRNGDPVFGMEERPVPQTNVPGEQTWPTQPFPIKPAPLAKNTFTPSDIYDLTPDHAAFCKELFEKNNMFTEGPYTPMPPGGPLGSNALLFPSTLGGGNWSGFSYDPSLGYIFTNVNNIGQWGHMEKRTDPKTGAVTYVRTSALGGYARFWNPANHIPCTKPPFGELVAVNVNTGDIAWKVPLGSVPELEAQGIHNTGSMNLGGGIATAGGLIFIAASNDHQFRAFESKTGKLLWQQSIDANGHTIPITYLGKTGRQYVAIMAAGGGGYFGGVPADTLIAFTLPAPGARAEPPVITERTGSKPAIPESKASLQPAPRALPEGPGRDLVARTCAGQCHDIRTVTSHRMSRPEWSAMVETMITRGAKASEI